jgi:hypothetical protein
MLAVGVWLLVVAAHACRLAGAHGRLRGVVSRSVPLDDDRRSSLSRIARDIGLPCLPEIRVSEEIEAPQVVGVVRPVVLLPAMVASLTPAERTMTICHELVHVRRRDIALGWVPAIAERLFFFHPLARLAAREYLVAREAACDAAVLRVLGVEPHDYGRLLVRLGISRSEPGFSAAGSSSSSSCLKRRLTMLDRSSSQAMRFYLPWMAVAALMLTLIPLRLVARASPEPLAEAALGAEPQSSAEPRVLESEIDRMLRDVERLTIDMRRLEDGAVVGAVEAELAQREVQEQAREVERRARAEARQVERASEVRAQAEEAERRARTETREVQRLAEAQARLAQAASTEAAAAARQAEIELQRSLAETQSALRMLAEQQSGAAKGSPQVELEVSQRRMRELIELRQQLERRREATSSFNENHPERQAVQKAREALEQQIRQLVDQLKTQPAAQSPDYAKLRELERALALERRATDAASLEKLFAQLEQLRRSQAEINAERSKLMEQQERLKEYEQRISAEVAKMLEQLKRLRAGQQF